jgi:hypothetical protein
LSLDLARLSEAERRRIVDDFLDDVLGGLDVDPSLAERMRMARPDLADEPSREPRTSSSQRCSAPACFSGCRGVPPAP